MHLVNPYIISTPLREWQFINSTATESSSLTLPSSINAGDLLIVFSVAVNASGFPTLVTPSGFTNKYNVTADEPGGDGRFSISVKKAAGSEDSSSVSITSGDKQTGVCLQFRPVNFSITSAANITLGNVDATSGEGNPSAQTSLSTGIKLPAIALGWGAGYPRQTAINFSTQSPTFDGLVQVTATSFTFQQIVGYRVQSDLVTDQTVDMTDYGSLNVLTVLQLYDNGL